MTSTDLNREAAVLPGPERVSSRVRDKERAVAAILQAAELVFAQYGLQAARTDEIAIKAGVAKGLLFHYFKNKEALYEAVLARAYEPLRQVLDTSVLRSTPPREALSFLVEKLLLSMGETPRAPAIFILESIQNHGEHYRRLGTPSLYRAFEDILRRGVRLGVFRKLDPHHTAVNIIGLCSFYFCATNNFTKAEAGEEPLGTKALARHKREVLGFVQAATEPD